MVRASPPRSQGLQSVIVPAWNAPETSFDSPVAAYERYRATLRLPETLRSGGSACTREMTDSPASRSPLLFASWKPIQPCSQPPAVAHDAPSADLHTTVRELRF